MGGSGKPVCGGRPSVVGETCERGRLDRRKLVRPRILGCVLVSDSITSRRRRRYRAAIVQTSPHERSRRAQAGQQR